MKKQSINKFKGNRALKQNFRNQTSQELAARFRHAMSIIGYINKKESRKRNSRIIQSVMKRFDTIYSETSLFRDSFRKVVLEIAEENGKNERCAAYAANTALELKF
ncbi:hypothetical protein COV88_00910 [Candidatus Saccharibacteria bacterium CG11_big_fil_rev_8_21_14_0_20_41_19]|nr:hypothetical protein [Candidatus Saccharibacteria bacterium]OIP86220.1 MAG: hypothetical protein AUK57_00385 [Candidatus Saccharibacteria bacterium CG2_30_41_52]PIQ71032.1 MAG: hypothetical protein COV88_00910 [Candidatus Saccharibacteria bacterium CG11_big_fil_rev_8_21_14_0_20_41_19]PIZ59433.1 MAG: hypothetical protein COY18_03540 [Candidatus Saccharibacteria bacterium CG_4_10_14_0_2_um_filter_41_11]PJC29386.1 MAG: hypothetical protein CO052_03645 [Candidatus Saccharibacteria bacterium CG_4